MDINNLLSKFSFGDFFSQPQTQAIASAVIIFIIGWFIATIIRGAVNRALKRTNLDEKISGSKGSTKFFGTLAYYIVMLFTLMLVLDKLGLQSALEPLNNLVDQFMAALPKVIFAGIIGYIGYMLAKVISSLVSIGGGVVDNWVDKTGFQNTDQLVNILQKVVFIVILIPFVVQAIATLDMEAISVPATALLGNFTNMIGNILVASAVLFLFVWGGRFIANFLKDLFVSLGVDNYASSLGLSSMVGDSSLSKILSNVIFFFLAFFGVITAVNILGLEDLTNIFNELLELTGQIFFGLLILVIGNFISKTIYDALMNGEGNQFVANVVRWASLGLFAAIALRQMGIANEIVELAFGLILGAVAVVIALAYGLGGREAAGKHFQEIIDKMKK